MKKILPILAFLALAGCSTENVNDDVSLDAKSASATDVATENSMGFYTGQNNGRKLKGTLQISNDCENLYLEIIPEGDPSELEEVDIWLTTELPSLNGGGNNINGESDFDLSHAINLRWTFPLSSFNMEENLLVFVKAWGSFTGPEVVESVNYTNYTFDVSGCTAECESGYMIGGHEFSEIPNSKNWGWFDQLDLSSTGVETREIHHKNGGLGGFVTLSWNSSSKEISVEEGEGVTITHIYLSETKPTETNAPGQFNKTQIYTDDNGIFWVIVKAEVCK